jgi:hypothetical protein
MSRDREEKRKKKAELARQLGVSKGDVDEHKDLAERERVTRPAVQLLERKAGFLSRLISREDDLVLALFLVELRRARLIKAFALDDMRHELGKVTYHRPAHFVVVVFASENVPASFDALRIDGHEVASEAIAAWETPRAVRIEGVAGVTKGAAVSMRGIARVEAKHDFPLEKSTATVAVEM